MTPDKVRKLLLFVLLVASAATFARAQQNDNALDKAKADAAIEQGQKLLQDRTRESLIQAVRKYQEALTLYRRIKDQPGEALALQNLGFIAQAVEEKEQALTFYEGASKIYRQLGDNINEVKSLPMIAKLQASLGQNQKAVDSSIRALDLYRKFGDRLNEAAILDVIGSIYQGMKDWRRALEYYSQAVTLFRDLNYRKREAATLKRIGWVHLGLEENQKALEIFLQALPLHRAAADLDSQAYTLKGMAQATKLLGDARKAIEFAQEALELYRAIPSPKGEAGMLSEIGLIHDSLSDFPKALEFYNQALAIYLGAKDELNEAAVRTNIGLTYESLGAHDRALEFHLQALLYSQKVKDRATEASILNNIGNTHLSLGNLQLALDSYQKARPMHREAGNFIGEANSLSGIGSVYEWMGQPGDALEYFNQALTQQRKVGHRHNEASSLYQLGNVYQSLGQPEKALDFFNQSLSLQRAVGDRFGEAITLNAIAVSYGHLNEPEKALNAYQLALAIHRAVGNRNGEGVLLANLGLLSASRGEKEKAADLYNQALVLLRATSDVPTEMGVLDNFGGLYLGSDTPKAFDYYQQALTLNRQVGAPNEDGHILYGLMLASHLLGKPQLSILYGKQAINTYQQIRSNVKRLDHGLEKSFLGSKEDAYRQLVEFLIAAGGRLPEAQLVLGLLKQQEYGDYVPPNPGTAVRTEACPFTPAEAAVWKRYEEAGDRIKKVAAEFRDLKLSGVERSDPRYEKMKAELDAASLSFRGLFDEFAKELEKQTPHSSEAATSLEKGNWGLDRSELSQNTVSLYTIVGPENYQVILTTPTKQISRAANPKVRAADLNRMVLEFRSALQDQSVDPKPLGQRLYTILVGPVEKDLKEAGAKTLVWSLYGTLRYLPIAALHDGSQYLVERYQNVIIAGERRTNVASSGPLRALGLGVSRTKDGSFRPLPHVRAELRALIREDEQQTEGILPGKVLLNEAFTLRTMQEALAPGSYPMVHIASHFIFKPGNDTDSFLLLGDGDKLTLDKIKSSATPFFRGVNLLTLSGCETATGSNANGRELEGFAMLAQEQGAQSVLATLWPVWDESTSDLMRRFYENRSVAKAMTKSEALRQAQLMLLRGENISRTVTQGNRVTAGAKPPFSHPYFWAPFILIGNWR